MCGICGKLNFEPRRYVDPALIQSMLGTMRHRGPDDDGCYINSEVGLGHLRLSIIDLSTGHQPLSNEDDTIWIVFNGEIYNFHELRTFLTAKGHRFKTQTDTEAIVHLYEELGPEGCLERLRGMFAFAIWDEKKKRLFLARDRVGIKPLYYNLTSDSLVFGSEIKSIFADPAVNREIGEEAIDRFLTFLYLPGEETLFKGIKKLPPGSYVLAQNGKTEVKQYWDLDFSKSRAGLRAKDAEEELLQLLSETVEQHMIADVPVGVLLSGGVDSTAALSFAAEKTAKPISSYTVGFSAPGVVDERPYARLAAKTFNTQHYEMSISSDDFCAFLPKYVWHMEEPVCEPPAVALYYVSKLASAHVKVLLSGEGGDEAFAGYSNYRNLLWLERIKNGLSPLAKSIGNAIGFGKFASPARISKYGSLMGAKFPDYYFSRTAVGLEHELRQNSLYSADFASAIDRTATLEPMIRLQQRVQGKNVLNSMLYIDTKTWLPDDLLIKADKMTMANSLELRVPLLDHKVLEFAAALPSSLKVRGITTKYLAKKVLRSRVPEAILKRRKVGFPVPYRRWLQADLRTWANDILLDRATIGRGYFSKSGMEKMLASNAETGNHFKEVFSLITLELLHRVFMDSGSQFQENSGTQRRAAGAGKLDQAGVHRMLATI